MTWATQDVFYTMHHLFLNRCGVYLVCFNMEWLVPDLAGNFVENGRTLVSLCLFSLSLIAARYTHRRRRSVETGRLR